MPCPVCYRLRACTEFPGSSAVEQPAVNRLVDGSNPSRGATFRSKAEFYQRFQGLAFPCRNIPRSMPNLNGLSKAPAAGLAERRTCDATEGASVGRDGSLSVPMVFHVFPSRNRVDHPRAKPWDIAGLTKLGLEHRTMSWKGVHSFTRVAPKATIAGISSISGPLRNCRDQAETVRATRQDPGHLLCNSPRPQAGRSGN